MTTEDIEQKLEGLVNKVKSGRYTPEQITQNVCDLADDFSNEISDAYENGYSRGCEEKAVETYD